jgi:ParB family chromosome partitioning protein
MPRRKKSAQPASRGLGPAESASGAKPETVTGLERSIESDGGAVLRAFRDPLGGHWQVLAALPIERVEPTPFQRDLSDAHVTRLARVLDALDRFLDPIIAVRGAEGGYWTPNGHHRLSALRRLGARTVVALVLPEPELAYKILALNTDKAHNLREKSLEVIRMARDLAERDPRPETDFALEFEEPSLLTLGACYEKNGRFAGGAYHPLLKRVDAFLPDPLPRAL